MYLREIIINGFKSYMNQTVVEQLDPKHNVVVGRNGSGKSNFFSAIEFVLSDEYTNLRQSERAGLINKGASKSPTESAFVEIVLVEKASISAEKKPSDCGETRVRRTISATKDQYKLNGRNATRREVVEMLDSLGLSTASPYYIVKQGKINQLAMSRPPQLLQVLFEIGGIRVYDEKLKETIKLMHDADLCLKQIRTVRSSLGERLKLLFNERKEQEQFEQLDKKHRLLSFMVLDKKHQEAVRALNALDHTEQSWKEQERQFVLQKSEAMEKSNELKRHRKDTSAELTNAQAKQTYLGEEHIRLQKQMVKLDLQLQDTVQELGRQRVDQEREQTELVRQQTDISDVQMQLETVARQLAAVQERKDTLESAFLKKKERRNEILDKQRRGIQFTTREARDQFLRNEIAYVCNQIKVQTEALGRMKIEHKELIGGLEIKKEDGTRYEGEHGTLANQENAYKAQLAQIGARLQESKTVRETLAADESRKMIELNHRRAQVSDHEQKLRKQIGTRVADGWRAVAKVLDMLRTQHADHHPVLAGYHGRVFEAFQCEEELFRAVETVAGSKLYYHIVESEAIANELIALCNKHQLRGEYNFMPLNKLQAGQQMHTAVRSDATVRPLVSLLTYDNRFEIVFQHIFGGTLLCDGLETAVNAHRQHQRSCVTRDGDMVGRGALTGGYRAPGTTKLHQALALCEMGAKIARLESDLQSIRKLKSKADEIIDKDEQDRVIVEAKHRKMVRNREQLQALLHAVPTQCRRLGEKCTELERKIRTQQTDLDLLVAKEESLRRELETQFICVLTEKEERFIAQLDEEIRCLRTQQNEAFNAELQVQREKDKLENRLNGQLIPKRDALIASLAGRSYGSLANQRTVYEQQQKTLSSKIDLLVQDISNVDKQVRDLTDKGKKLTKELEYWLKKLKHAEEAISTKDPRETSHEARKRQLAAEVNRYAKEIEALGVLPAFDQGYDKMTLPKLMQELERTSKQLKKFSSVNKTAVDEYARVSQSLSVMDRKLKESEDTRKMHESTVQRLQAQRMDCIEHIFNTVNRNFIEIFSRFVPAGCGKLILQTTDGNADSDDTTTDESYDGDGVPDRYVGLAVEVSFMASEGTRSELGTLSGGQKTLVAIALIFAMQKYNPAPFYLFDEIDQALDSGHRKVVANEIHALSANSQFITITFRRELLEHADKYFGVRYRNTASSIGAVSKERAFDFVVDDTIRR
ncbi:structural maintenance of chromosomes protein 3-like [Anopheles stephensi]|uniref:structural maintenance of chromosomes protein 3-like n=1 Tax=Anopheles stephensi TaxID=30069 RepID=UPI001658C0CB|nr:structural maintenance of chromosomes protein 3-like [Anopheles stephensi]XP_035913435.1 structural maintenance of chromosomes protein 3-like [Anopheles stephensi]